MYRQIQLAGLSLALFLQAAVGSAFAAETKDIEYYVKQAAACRTNKDYKGGLENTNKAISLNSKDGDLFALRAYFKSKTGDNAGAIKDATEGIRLDPKAFEIYEIRAGIYLMQGEYRLALKDGDSMVAIDPKTADGYLIRSAAQYALNSLDVAASELHTALNISPSDSMAQELATSMSKSFAERAQTRADAGNTEGAIQDCDEDISLNSQNDQAVALKAKLGGGAKKTDTSKSTDAGK